MEKPGKLLIGRRRFMLAAAAAPLATTLPFAQAAPHDPLPSWRNGTAKKAIMDFVGTVTNTESKEYVEPENRIAVFDNDGTLWSEQPLYFQLYFMIAQLKEASPRHPEWKNDPVFNALMTGDVNAIVKQGVKPALELLAVANAGMTTEEYGRKIDDWIHFARHPRFNRPYTDLVYQPMRELLAYFKANWFKNFIVSGGGIEFMRAWARHAYDIPPEHVIGSSIKVEFAMKDGQPVLNRLPKLDFIDDGAGKPVGIYRNIGQRPIAAFGNSDGDLQMLQWTAGGKGARLLGLIHHTDRQREWAYDRGSPIGLLDKALDEAYAKGWTVVDMARDWSRIYRFE
ncbi:HAD family hydrolase [Oxalicibacterium solurbis]|uniref:Haloacid dehalogenase n=1 Tax=Oxalicibacterium solurbis TaxID=69280 RepID=A0A8J3F4R8_9BURK|nr:HAD family hydrolase [Oxalicibacterium solurbis]GGI52846.1 haloacid dehalogenase [Oxalicibacterium solurbis]